ncbi:MAG: hypothetical protein LBB51_03775 [Zoogloeaceae bacterium]|jgi:hypothetical protein|nr:hypothetical protein [Zoogloeaceae bacterium]
MNRFPAFPLLCTLLVLPLLPFFAHAEDARNAWSPSVRKSLAAALECRALLAPDAPALKSLSTATAGNWQGHQAQPPEDFRLFGLPVHKIWVFHDGNDKDKDKAAGMVAIAAFRETVVDWKRLVGAAKLRDETLMGETASVRKTAIGLLEGWREAPFWIELAESSQPATAKTGNIYLVCGTGGEITDVLPLRPETRK